MADDSDSDDDDFDDLLLAAAAPPAAAYIPRGPLDEGRMDLTPEERSWALEIKTAAASKRELEPLSDYMYAQLALVTLSDPNETNLACAMDRIANYQQYMAEHKIVDDLQFACRALDKTLLELIPGHYISFGYDRTEGCYVNGMDIATFDRGVLPDKHKLDTFLATVFFIMHAQQPDFEAIRRGIMCIFECSNYDWRNKDMCNMAVVRRISELENSYPVHVHKLKYFNTGMFINMAVSLARKLLSPLATKGIEVGCRVDNGTTLDRILVVPDLQTTNKRNLALLKDALTRRYKNQREFSLQEEEHHSPQER